MRRFFARLISFIRCERAEQEMVREIDSHLALLQDDFERRGMLPQQARLAARRAYGGVEQVKELHRDERSFIWLEQALHDVRLACRGFVRNPGFTSVAVITLALGIGVNTTLFTAYNAVALKPLPVADPQEVVRFERWFASESRGDNQYAFSYAEYAYCRDHNDAFSSLIAASWPVRILAALPAGAGQESGPFEKLHGQIVSANYFADLGISPRLGRTFAPAWAFTV